MRKCPTGWSAKGAVGSPPNTTCCPAAPARGNAANATARSTAARPKSNGLIGRSLRAIVDLDALGERTIAIDCDVLEADGGTRTASITGAYVALCDALSTIGSSFDAAGSPLRSSVAAISVGIVDGEPLLDLDYSEDVEASVDMNVVMTGDGRFIEVQGTGEEATFSEEELQKLLGLRADRDQSVDGTATRRIGGVVN